MSDIGKLLQLTAVVRNREPLPRDVARWALDCVARALPPAARTDARNQLLREAAALVGGSRWARMRALQTAIEDERKQMTDPQPPPAGTVADFVHRALLVDPACPTSESQLLRVLADDLDASEDPATNLQ